MQAQDRGSGAQHRSKEIYIGSPFVAVQPSFACEQHGIELCHRNSDYVSPQRSELGCLIVFWPRVGCSAVRQSSLFIVNEQGIIHGRSVPTEKQIKNRNIIKNTLMIFYI